MKFYTEITLLPNAEIPLYFIWEKAFQQIHLALVDLQDADGKVNIGAAFPEYGEKKNHLGSKLRLFAPSQADIEKLNIQKWLSRLSDYLHISSVRQVPDRIDGYVVFKRIQPKSNNARLARRKAKREDISYEKAVAYFKNKKEQTSKLPFINIKSLSSNKRYRLIISSTKTDIKSDSKKFSTYGLSAKSTVPWFK